MPQDKSTITTKVATLALPTREAHVVANIWPGPRGMLLFLAELNLAPQTRQEFIQNFNAEIERVWQEIKNSSLPTDEILENIVLSVNQMLVGQERLMGNPLSPRYQLLLAYLSGQQVAISNLGHINAFVISANKLSNVLVSAGRQKIGKPSSTFDNLITGELIPGESLLLATNTLSDYFSWDRLRQLIPNRPPGQSLREIEKYMLQLKVHPPLGLICLKLSLASESETTGASMEHLLKTKAQTASLLQPKLISYLKSKIYSVKTKPANYITQPRAIAKEEKAPAIPSQDRLNGGLNSFIAKISRYLKSLSWLTNRESAKSTIAWWLESNLAKWRRLPKMQRALGLIGFILLLAFSQSIVNIGKHNLIASDSEYYNNLVTQITEKQAEIESVLIYKDNDKALSLFNEAKAYLAKLPRNSKSREIQWQALSQNLSLLARRLQHLNEIAEPPLWSRLPPPPTGKVWQHLINDGQKVFVIASGGKILVLDAAGQVSSESILLSELSDIEKVILGNKEILLIDKNNKAGFYNTANGQVSLINQSPALQSGGFYNDGLYYLSQENRTIWRVSRTNKGFSPPTLWLRQSQGNLPAAQALAVDGSIYVASATTVEKFTRGIKQEFKLSPVDPPLSAVSDLSTANDKDFLYLWEKANNRLIVYDKGGKLIIQITLPTLANITAITVDATNKIFYAMAENMVYRIPILEPVR